jgi:hypothetical protein
VSNAPGRKVRCGCGCACEKVRIVRRHVQSIYTHRVLARSADMGVHRVAELLGLIRLSLCYELMQLEHLRIRAPLLFNNGFAI